MHISWQGYRHERKILKFVKTFYVSRRRKMSITTTTITTTIKSLCRKWRSTCSTPRRKRTSTSRAWDRRRLIFKKDFSSSDSRPNGAFRRNAGVTSGRRDFCVVDRSLNKLVGLKVVFKNVLNHACWGFFSLANFKPGSTQGGVSLYCWPPVSPLSCMTGLEQAVWQLTIFVFICKTG